MSVLDRTLSAVKDVLLLRDQMKDLREDVQALAGDVAGLVGDIRQLDRRVSRLEGSEQMLRALASRNPQLPES